MQQLKMICNNRKGLARALPEGYHYEMYQGTQEQIQDWIEICATGQLLAQNNYAEFERLILNYPDLVPEEDVFFVVDASGKRVATSAGVCESNGEGYVHMVGALPECRGKGIGHAMLFHSLELCEKKGCNKFVLTTDDFRLAAIKTYLDAGFVPVIYFDADSDMRARWDAVIEKMNYPTPVTYVEE